LEKKIKVADLKGKLSEKFSSRAPLILKVNYYISIFSILFCCLCLFALDITEIVPWVFLSFGILNLINTIAFGSHRNLRLTYTIVSVLTLIGATIITLYTGGINSPFIFVLALVVVANYIDTKSFGSLFLNLNLLIIVLIYSQSIVAKEKVEIDVFLSLYQTRLL